MSKCALRSVVCIMLSVIMILTMAAVPVSAAKISLNKSSVTLVVGKSVYLSVNGTSKKVTWSSKDTSIAEVTKIGKVTAVKSGSTEVTATVDGKSYSCDVTVKEGSVSAGNKSVFVDKKKTIAVKIKAVRTQELEYSVENSKIATASFDKSGFTGDTTTINITGVDDGVTTVKVWAKGYEKSIYTTIAVKVGAGRKPVEITKSGIDISADFVEVNENSSEEFEISSKKVDISKLKIVSTATSHFSVETEEKKGKIEITVNGICENDNCNIRIFNEDKSINIYIPVTVTNNAYDIAVWNSTPKIRQYNDVIYTSCDKNGKSYYVLEPEGTDTAHAATVLGTAADWYEYYVVFEKRPSKQESTDVVVTKSLTYNGKKVTRYLLCEKDYDTAVAYSMFGIYSGDYDYNVVYVNQPVTKQREDTILYYIYTKSSGEKEIRYIIKKADDYADKAEKAAASYAKKYSGKMELVEDINDLFIT